MYVCMYVYVCIYSVDVYDVESGERVTTLQPENRQEQDVIEYIYMYCGYI